MIKAFYHCYLVNSWRDVIADQVNKVLHSGLYDSCYDITVTVSGSAKNRKTLIELLKPFPKFVVTAWETEDNGKEELLAMEQIHKFASKCETNIPIFYFHTKGISREGEKGEQPTRAWRKLLDYYNIFNWRANLRVMDQLRVDMCGILFAVKWSDVPVLFNEEYRKRKALWLGNYWWSNAGYIKKLPDPTKLPFSRSNNDEWISMCNNLQAFSFYRTDKNLYEEVIKEEEYIWNEKKDCIATLSVCDATKDDIAFRRYKLKRKGTMIAIKAL